VLIGWLVAIGVSLGVGQEVARKATEAREAKAAYEASLMRVWVAARDIDAGTTVTPDLFVSKRVPLPYGRYGGFVTDEFELTKGLRVEQPIAKDTPLTKAMLEGELAFRGWPAGYIDTSGVADSTYVDVILSDSRGTLATLRKVWLRIIDGNVHLLTAERDAFFVAERAPRVSLVSGGAP